MSEITAAIIHGGTWMSETSDPIISIRREEQRRGLLPVIEYCADMLQTGSAIDIAAGAVTMLEDNPAFNAGTGSEIDEKGVISMDASIMVGSTREAGAVTGITEYRNPIQLARLVLYQPNLVFVTQDGVEKLAEQAGIPKVTQNDLTTDLTAYLWQQEIDRQRAGRFGAGTVGAVVRDKDGELAAATSTGGFNWKPVGRIGDSPLIGAGTYAGPIAAASATGIGEQFTRIPATYNAVMLHKLGFTPQDACESTIREIDTLPNGKGGIIFINKLGEFGAASNAFVMPHALVSSKMRHPRVNVTRNR